MNATCERCGVVYTRPPSMLARVKRHFCSRACWKASVQRQPARECVCEWCRAEFTTPFRTNMLPEKYGRFCSANCRAQYAVRQPKPGNRGERSYNYKHGLYAGRKAGVIVRTDRDRIQDAVRHAVKRGRIVKSATCKRCGDSPKRMHAHHQDYSKPLEVQWLCGPCHARTHWDGHLKGRKAA